MPELPEVETVKRGLQLILEGQTITHVLVMRRDLRFPIPEALEQRLIGRKILSLDRRAKYLRILLEGGDILVTHLGMSGRFLINPEKPYQLHTHFIITTGQGQEVAYFDPRRFGYMALILQTALEKHPFFIHLGPEPLEEDFDGAYLYNTLQKRRSPIKSILLDQTVVAGLGNIYVCEALYRASISPLTPGNRITTQECERLVAAIILVLRQAIIAGGSSLRDYRQANGALGTFQYGFQVYGRKAQACFKCHSPIGCIKIAGRSTFYCAVCQKEI